MRRRTRRRLAGVVRTGAVLGAASLALGAAACGGTDRGRRFEAEGIGLTFRYPSELERIARVSFGLTAGGPATARGGAGLDRDNAIIVSRYALRASVSTSDLQSYKGEVDAVIGRLAGRPVSGRRVEYGGLPGYEYTISLSTPAGARSRLVVLFDGATEYLLNCQSTPSGRRLIDDACAEALDTLERR